jgi:hypothetical protein
MIIQVNQYLKLSELKFRIKDSDEEFKFITLYDEFAVPNAYHNVLSKPERDEFDARNIYAFCKKICKQNKTMEVRPYAFKTNQVDKIKKITLEQLPHWKPPFRSWGNAKKQYFILVNKCNELSRMSFDDYLKKTIRAPNLFVDNTNYINCEKRLNLLQKEISKISIF